jgi:hypothetical protein
MAQQHLRCPACGLLDLFTYRAADVDDPHLWPMVCPGCGAAHLERAPQPGDFAIDAKEPFQRFTFYRQQPDRAGHLVQVEETIDSLHKVRAIEKDSEQRYIDGEGEPLRFRGYSTSASNRDVPGFGREGTIGGRAYDSGQQPAKKPNIDVTRHGQQKPRIPVARHAGQSPLSALKPSGS